MIRKTFHYFIFLITILSLLYPLQSGRASEYSQITTPENLAAKMLNKMSPAERVGQLFLVGFKGSNVDQESQIFSLVTNHHIGGVILTTGNDNFSDPEDILNQTLLLNQELQMNRWLYTQGEITPTIQTQTASLNYIPLFLGISQEGGGYPYDQILSGITTLPNAMALGATWNPDLAKKVGEILGRELSALGFNLLLGPALDVLETPLPEGTQDLGILSFGGDPYWVSAFGSAYIQGVHEGSKYRIAVVAKNFPGNGGSDRSPEIEVATVRKSLEELTKFDLLPFFAVTGNSQSEGSTADALLAAHIRYQGFQENIRAATRPISFDQQAFSLLMSLPAISSWRENNGLIICDNLGSQAVQKFYELTGQKFDSRLVALNAFLAGNDLLHLGNIQSYDDPDSYTSIVRVLEFFTQKYMEDLTFAAQVDESVQRILTLKYKLYPDFDLQFVLPQSEILDDIGNAQQTVYEVAREAITLISPSTLEINTDLPNPPKLSERIVFISDVRKAQQCSQCPVHTVLGVDTLSETVIRFYGPQASGQIWPANMTSFSFDDLLQVLNNDPKAPPLANEINKAQWIVFSLLNTSPELPVTMALNRFLAERPDLFQNKKLVIFAFNAPYYLDATNISKVTAYYGLYSNTQVFFDVAARILFHELFPLGNLPVSVPGVGYDLITATSPNPNQIIPLYINIPGQDNSTTSTPELEKQIPSFKVGEQLPIRTGLILDHNGNPVPDGTPVEFILNTGGDILSLPQPIITFAGVAQTSIKLTLPGIWEIRVESEPAKQSEIIRLDVIGIGPDQSTETPLPIPTETLVPTVSPTEAGIATIEETPLEPRHLDFFDWFVAAMIAVIIGFGTYRLFTTSGEMRAGVRGGFLATIGGLVAYCYLVFNFPGGGGILSAIGTGGVILVTALGALCGTATAWIWHTRRTQNTIHISGQK